MAYLYTEKQSTIAGNFAHFLFTFSYLNPITTTGSYSVCLWFNGASVSSGALIDISNGSSNRNGINFYNGILQGGYYNGSYYAGKKSSSLSPNTWNNVILINSGGVVSLYLNGILQSTSGMSLLGGGYSIMGYNSNASYLNGSLDDVRVYNRALSVAEIVAIYNATQ